MRSRATSWILAITITVAGIFFSRAIRDSFDLTKATFVALVGSFMLGAILRDVPSIWRRSETLIAGALLASLLISLAFSLSPWMSLIGQPLRYTGLAVLSSVVVLFLWATRLEDRRDVQRVSNAYMIASLANSLYCLVQLSGNDPWEWSTSSFGVAVFGTIGNPNTSAYFTAGAIPLAFIQSIDPRSKLLVRSLAAATFGLGTSVLAPLSSFQGNMALLLTLILVVVFSHRFLGSLLESVSVVVVLLVAVAVSFWANTAPRVLLSSIGLAALVVAVAMFVIRGVKQFETRPRSRSFEWMLMGSIGAGALVVGRGRINAGLADGLIERGDFYRTAWRVFSSNPILGTGLDTFGLVFSRYRPATHALRLEDNRTTSVHSIPLGMFQAGGLILGLAFATFLFFVSLRAVRIVKRSQRDDLFNLGLSMSWFALVFQSLVSVEHVSNYLVLFVIGGLVVARSREELRETRSGRTGASQMRMNMIALTIGVIAVAVSSFVVLRPFASELAERRAQKAIARGDGNAALLALDDAVSLVPIDFFMLIQRAELRLRAGDMDGSVEDASRAAQLSGFSAVLTLNASVIIANAGRYLQAADLVGKAIANDPFAAKTRASGIDLLSQISTAAESVGQVEVARLVRERGSALVNESPQSGETSG